MEDTTLLIQKIAAFESENNSLKNVIEQLVAEKQALDQTVVEVLRANISLKAGANLLEKKVATFMSENDSLKAQLAQLSCPAPESNPEKKSKK